MTADVATPTPGRTSWRSLPPLALVPVGALAWWVVGFLPWILDGLGNDLRFETRALPLFAGNVSALVVGAGLGGVVGGLAARLGTGSRAARAGASATGVAIALFITLLQSRSAASAGVDGRITNGLTVVVILTALVGLAIGLLSTIGRVGLGFALAAVAGVLPVWLMAVFNAMGVGYGSDLRDVQELCRWTGAAVLVVALIVAGLQPAVRAVAWLGIVLLAWFIAPTITAAGYMEVFLRPGMGLPDMWSDHLSASADVWRMSASLEARPLTPWIVAIAVAGAAAVWLARRPITRPVQPAQ